MDDGDIIGAFPSSCPRAYKAAPRPAKFGSQVPMQSSGFEHVFVGEIRDEKVLSIGVSCLGPGFGNGVPTFTSRGQPGFMHPPPTRPKDSSPHV